MSDAITKIADSLVNHEDRLANLEKQETPPAIVGTPVTAVTASPPLSSSGGSTPNITHNVSGIAAGVYTYPTSITYDTYGHATTATSGSRPATSASAPLSLSAGNMTLAITTTNNGGAVALQTSGAPVAQTGYASLASSGQNVLTIAATSSVVGITATSQTGNAVQGTSSSSGGGVAGTSSSGAGVTGTSTSGAGMVASSNSSTGLSASSSSGIGILASSSSNYGIQVDKINVTSIYYSSGLKWGGVAVTSFPGSPTNQERADHKTTQQDYHYETGFSGPSAAWYRNGVGIKDTFTRADSATYPGVPELAPTTWYPVAGTWGISTNRLYSVSNANLDIVIADSLTSEVTLQTTVSGELNSATNFRGIAPIFRYIDTNNFLRADLLNGQVRLVKRDGGTPTTLSTAAQTTTNGTDYVLTVVANGLAINVYVDGVSKISFTLTTAEFKYLASTFVGYQFYKGGSVSTEAYAKLLTIKQKANIA